MAYWTLSPNDFIYDPSLISPFIRGLEIKFDWLTSCLQHQSGVHNTGELMRTLEAFKEANAILKPVLPSA